MYLIDTSVWIDWFRNRTNPAVDCLTGIMLEAIPFGITGSIYQEILQGAASKKDFETLTDYLDTQRFFHPLDPVLSYAEAARIYFNCRERGITIRSTIDCLIAQIAIEHDLVLVHKDRDYRQIRKSGVALKLYDDRK